LESRENVKFLSSLKILMQLVELPMMLKARVKVVREDLTLKSLN
jgi:hypothetical protein